MGLYQDIAHDLKAAKEQANSVRLRVARAKEGTDDAIQLATEAGFNAAASGLVALRGRTNALMAQAMTLAAEIETAERALYEIHLVPQGGLPGEGATT